MWSTGPVSALLGLTDLLIAQNCIKENKIFKDYGYFGDFSVVMRDL